MNLNRILLHNRNNNLRILTNFWYKYFHIIDRYYKIELKFMILCSFNLGPKQNQNTFSQQVYKKIETCFSLFCMSMRVIKYDRCQPML